MLGELENAIRFMFFIHWRLLSLLLCSASAAGTRRTSSISIVQFFSCRCLVYVVNFLFLLISPFLSVRSLTLSPTHSDDLTRDSCSVRSVSLARLKLFL